MYIQISLKQVIGVELKNTPYGGTTLMKETKIVIIEDDKIFREAFGLLLNSSNHYEVVNTYSTCEEAIEHLDEDMPHIIIMDIHLPGMSGIDATKIIKTISPKINILIISGNKDNRVALEAFSAGAVGFITKDSEYIDFIEAIRQVEEGGSPMSKTVSRYVVESFHANFESPLSERESQVLQLLSQGQTYKEIAEKLFIHPETVKSHLKNIYTKLDVHNKADAIMKAVQERLIRH